MNDKIILIPIRKIRFNGGSVPEKLRAQLLARKRIFYHAERLGLISQPGFQPKTPHHPKMIEKEFVQMFSVTQWKQLKQCVIQALGMEGLQNGRGRKRHRQKRR